MKLRKAFESKNFCMSTVKYVTLLVHILIITLVTACSGTSENPRATPLEPTQIVLDAGVESTNSPTITPMSSPTIATNTPTPVPRTPIMLKSEVVEGKTGFVVAMEFAPDGRLFYAEREGKVLVKQLDQRRVWDSPTAEKFIELHVALSSGESGLLGLALSPTFDEDHHVFLYYVIPDDNGNPEKSRIVRYTEVGNVATEETVIVDNLPARADQQFHFGGGLSFGPDGKLYLIFGDTNRTREARNPETLPGSILRYNADGTIPEDNPFPGSPVYSYGIRNGFGLEWHPETHLLYSIENGTFCDDELNLIEAGGDYGWGTYPWDQCPYPDDRGLVPIYQWARAIAPAGITFYTGRMFPEFR